MEEEERVSINSCLDDWKTQSTDSLSGKYWRQRFATALSFAYPLQDIRYNTTALSLYRKG